MVDLNFLKKTEIFNGLNDEQLTAVQACCKTMEFQQGSRLFAEGDDAAYLWIVVKGQVDIRFDLPGRPSSEENNVSSVTETKTCGWSSLVPPNKYRLSGYCATRTCEVVRIEKDCLTSLFEKDTGIGYKVMKNITAVIGRRFHQLQGTVTSSPLAKTEVIVHLATCGIAAGAREVMSALMEEIAQTGRTDVKVSTAGCMGRCPTEPNVTVKIGGTEPVIYQHINGDKMRQIFKTHVMKGEVQKDFVLVSA